MANTMQTVHRLTPTAERYVPVAQVSFHTDSKCYKVRGIAKGYDAVPDPTDKLLSIATNKTLEAPAGTFQITLAGGEWFSTDGSSVLKPNDLVVIYMGYKAKGNAVTWVDGTTHTGSEDLDTVMIGLIDTVTRNRNGGGSGMTPSVQTIVTGRDFGKLLIKANLKFYPELGWKDADAQKFFLTEQGWITLLKAFTNDNAIKGSPAKILDTIMRFILKKVVNVQWKVYDDNINTSGYKTVGMTNILRYAFGQTNFFIPFFMSAQQYEGSVWNLMDRVNIKPFTEMFIDTRDAWEIDNNQSVPMVVNETMEEFSDYSKGKLSEDNGRWNYPSTQFGSKDKAQVFLAYRNTPFDKDSWNKLRSHAVYDKDVIQESLSYTDNENYNLFWAGSTLTPFATLDLKRVMPPLINKDNVTRYGLNPLEISVEGLQLDISQETNQTVALEGLSNHLNAKLKAWFENNVNYLSGNLTMRGKGSLKIGQRLSYKSINREFYIEAVTQNFQVYGEWNTQLNLTRGLTEAPSYSGYIIPTAKPAPPAPVPATQAPTPVTRYYTVVQGDTLWGIASKKQYYGNGAMWTKIWEANKDMLIARDKRNATDHGHWIFPGQKLIIP